MKSVSIWKIFVKYTQIRQSNTNTNTNISSCGFSNTNTNTNTDICVFKYKYKYKYVFDPSPGMNLGLTLLILNMIIQARFTTLTSDFYGHGPQAIKFLRDWLLGKFSQSYCTTNISMG